MWKAMVDVAIAIASARDGRKLDIDRAKSPSSTCSNSLSMSRLSWLQMVISAGNLNCRW
ncbi:hypothetical protein P3T22_001555 [Paraburkholderia sp. GAS348]